MSMQDNPILVEVHRGGQVESRHHGTVVAVDAEGDTVFSLGQTAQWIYPRSALKLFQAIPLLESGAADQFNLTQAEIALACASHNAEPFHTRAILAWLHRLGVDGNALECGAQWPLLEYATELAARGEKPNQVHHNCSGKHSGMLTLADFMNADRCGYSDYQHPTQQAWMHTLSELLALDVFSLPWELDGCGLPAICMPLEQLARAFALYAQPQKTRNPSDKNGKRGIAMQRIVDAVCAYPQMLAGTNRCCTDVIRESNGRVLIKTGAEGVYGGVIPHLGIGFALKIEDGAGRAAKVAVGALLNQLGALENIDETKLAQHFQPTITNSNGKTTGKILPSENW